MAEQFEVRLAIGELELAEGNTEDGRTRLAALQKDAEARGFALNVGTARRAPKGQ